MKIEIKYSLKQEEEIIFLSLTPEEFYDPLEKGETYEEDGIHKFNETFQFINEDINLLEWSVLKIECYKGRYLERCQYLDGENTMMVHTIDFDESEEIIHCSLIDKNKWNITKSSKTKDGYWSVYMNCICSDTNIPKSTNLIKNYSIEEMKSFSNIF